MCGLQSRDNSLLLRQSLETQESLGIGGGDELSTVGLLPGRKLGSDSGVVQTSGNRVSVRNLSVLVLENVGPDSVENSDLSSSQSSRVTVSVNTISSSLNSDESYRQVLGEGVEHSNAVGASSDTSNNNIGKLSAELLELGLGLVSNDGLESTDNSGEGVRTYGGSNDVVGGGESGDPSTKGLVDGITKGASSSLDSNNGGSEKLHTEDVESLTTDVLSPHVDGTLETELSTNSSGGDSMLSGSGLGNDLLLSETTCQKNLSKGVVDLVGSSVVEVLTLQPDLSSSTVLGETVGELKVAGTSHVGVVGTVLLPEGGVIVGLDKAGLKLSKTIHQRLGNVLSSELTEAVRDGVGVDGGTSAVESLDLLNDSGAGGNVLLGDDGAGVCIELVELGGLVDGLVEANLAGSRGSAGSNDLGTVVLHGLETVLGRGVCEDSDELRSDNDSLGNLSDGQEVLTGGDSESNGNGDVSGVLVDALAQGRETGIEGSSGTGNTHTGDDVDERVGNGAEKLHAIVGSGGSNERDIAHSEQNTVSLEV